jgi:hypothetical protein
MAYPMGIDLAKDKTTQWTRPGEERRSPPGWLLRKWAEEAEVKRVKAAEVQEAADRARVMMKGSYAASKAFLKLAKRAETDGTIEE